MVKVLVNKSAGMVNAEYLVQERSAVTLRSAVGRPLEPEDRAMVIRMAHAALGTKPGQLRVESKATDSVLRLVKGGVEMV